MKKRIKLLFSLMAFCVALASLIFGVYAAQTFSYEYNGSMSYNVSYGFLQIETSVYKYNKKPLTSTQAQAYYDDLSELILVPEYSHSYSTYDANNLLKGNVENQTYNLNFDYDDGYVFFIVVNVKSLSTEPIKATLSSNHNIANSWSHNSGNTVILKNDSGENIIFCNGITDVFKRCNGSFSYNINFDIQQSYTPTTTGTFSYSSLNSGISSFSKSFDKKTEADDFEKTVSVELPASQLISDGENVAVIMNFIAKDFFYEQVFSYRFKNVKLYKSNGDIINDSLIYYTYVNGMNLTSMQDIENFVTSSAYDELDITTMPKKCTVEVARFNEEKTTLMIVINDESVIPEISKIAFDFEIKMIENVKRNASNVDYEYKITLKLDETASIMPGKNTSKNVETMEFYGGSYDIIDAPDYVVEARVSVNSMLKYLEMYGRYEIPTMELNPDFYGNILVWIQALILVYSQESIFGEIGYLPIPIEDVTLPIDDDTYVTFLRNNWFLDIMQMMMLANSVSREELTYLASQYLTPMPTDRDESIYIPFKIGRLENLSVDMYFGLLEMIEEIFSSEKMDFNLPILDFLMLLELPVAAELFRQSPEGPESFGLSKNFRLAEFATMLQSGLLDDADPGISMEQLQTITVDYIFFVPGTTFSDLEGAIVTECYYESVDTVIYNSSDIGLDLYAIPIKEYKTDNSALIAIDGVLYTKEGTLAKYPSLKAGGMYNVVDGTKSISKNAFSGAKNLSRIMLPKSIEKIEENAFKGSSVSTLYIYNNMINTQTKELIDILNNSNIVALYVMMTGYISDARYNKLTEDVSCSVNKMIVDNQSGLTFALGDDGAYVSGISNKNVEFVIIPQKVMIGETEETVKRIGQNAFKDCTKLSNIEIPTTITSIGDNAFAGCVSLKEIHFDSASISEIGTGNIRNDMMIYTTSDTTARTVSLVMENSYWIDWWVSIYDYPNYDLEYEHTVKVGSKEFKVNQYNRTFNEDVIFTMDTEENQLVSVKVKIYSPSNDGNDIIEEYVQVTKYSESSNSSGTTIIGSTNLSQTIGQRVNKTYPTTGLGVSTAVNTRLYVRICVETSKVN